MSPLGSNGFFLDVVIDSKDRIVLSGRDTSVQQGVVVRLLRDGQVDETFGTGGIKYVSFLKTGSFFSSQYEEIAALAVAPDDSLYVAGSVSSGSPSDTIFVSRLLENGAIDSAFNGTGVFRFTARYTSFSGGGLTQNYITSLALQDDGKVVVSGYCQTEYARAVLLTLRLEKNGTLDNTFGVGGVVQTSWSEFSSSFFTNWTRAVRAIVRNDGKIIISCSGLGDYVNSYALLLCLNSDGTVDTSFANKGILSFLRAGASYTNPGGILQLENGVLYWATTSALPQFSFVAEVLAIGSDGSRLQTLTIDGKSTSNSYVSHRLVSTTFYGTKRILGVGGGQFFSIFVNGTMDATTLSRCRLSFSLFPVGFAVQSDLTAMGTSWQSLVTCRLSNASLTCKACSPGQVAKFLVNGAVNVSATGCISCPTSTVAVNDTFCAPCSPGTFWETPVANPLTASCSPCPPNTYQNTTGALSCLPCGPGFEQPDYFRALCIPCRPGSFKPGTGNYSCLPCPRGTYSSTSGATLCTSCPVNTWSSEVGVSNALLCQPCLVLGQICASGSTSSANCSCPPLSSTVGTSCQCNAGAFLVSSSPFTCQMCSNATWKADVANSECSVCPQNAFVPTFLLPGKNSSDCIACASNAVRTGTFCSCNSGFEPGPGGVGCVPCGSTSYKSSIGNVACSSCPAGAIVLGPNQPAIDISQCTCPTLMVIGLTGSFCECVAGYTYNTSQGICVGCGSTSFKAQIGNGTCSACPNRASVPVGLAPATNVSSCQCLQSGNVKDPSTGLCVCGLGYEFVSAGGAGGTCQPCSGSAYKDFIGDAPCVTCPSGQSIAGNMQPGTNVSQCQCVGAHKVGSGCVCDVGYYDNGAGTCLPCSSSQYKDFVGSSACIDCPIHGVVPVAQQPGVARGACACPPNSVLSSGGTACLCVPGYEWNNNNTCRACASNEWKSVYGDFGCTGCPSGAQIPVVFQPGTNASQCQCVGANKVPPTCQCDEGFFLSSADSTCQPCAASAWKQFVSDATSCNACPTGSSVPANLQPGKKISDCKCTGAGQVATLGACLCDVGYGWDVVNSRCVQCGSAFYKDTISNTACLACPSLALVPAALLPGANVSSCVCPPNSSPGATSGQCECRVGIGFAGFASNPPCIPCQNIEFKSAQGNFPCTACPENSLVLRGDGKGAQSADECVCIGSRYRKNGGCTSCVSPGGNCTTGFLLTAVGYWRPNSTYERFVACIPTKACVGDSVVANSTNTSAPRAVSSSSGGCAQGYAGFMCATCDAGYAWSGSACVTCEGANIPLIVGLAILSVAFVGYIYWTVGSETVSKISIFVNYLQLLAQSYVVASIKFLPLAEFNWITMASASSSCIFPFTWTGLWLFTMCIPLILLLVVFLFFLGRILYKALHQRFRHEDRTRKCKDPAGKKPVGTNSMQAAVMLILFNYLLIAKTSLSMFACVDVFGYSMNAQNYSFPCGTALQYGLNVMAAVWIAFFCVAVPLVVLLRIVIPERMPRFTKHLDVEFLTVHFRDEYRWWETVFVLRRLVFAVIVTIIAANPNVKVLVFSLFAFSFLVAQLWCQPYKKLLDNFLEFLGLCAIVITFSLQAHVLAYGDPDDVILIFVVVLNGLVLAVMGIFVLLDAIPMIYHKIRGFITARKRNKALQIVAAAKASDDGAELHVVEMSDIDKKLRVLQVTAGGTNDMAISLKKPTKG